jgi:hypothetical protein
MAPRVQAAEPTLLVLAAGMGSRYGGLKQIDPVGPSGETILEYSVFDALRSGFGKVVFLIRRDIEEEFRKVVGSKFEDKANVEYAFQELSDLPEGFHAPEGRTKPWGTTHAILCAEEKLEGAFSAINADDFYGEGAYRALAAHLSKNSPDFAMVGFVLRNTLSDHGSVARGVCRVDGEGYLEEIVERTNVSRNGNGAIYVDGEGQEHRLTGDELVSMNFWGFHSGLFAPLREIFARFLTESGSDLKSEHYIPNAVGEMIRSGAARVQVLRSSDPWCGVTYKEDRPAVVQTIAGLVADKRYPVKLWS